MACFWCTMPPMKNPDNNLHPIIYVFLNVLAKKYNSADSFLVALGFTVLTSWKARARPSRSLCVSAPSQYLHSSEPPGRSSFSASSRSERHMDTSLSWSSSLSPVAFGAMSLRMTSARAWGRSSCSSAWVAGLVISRLDRKWAPCKGAMCSRSIPSTCPLAKSGPVTRKQRNGKTFIVVKSETGVRANTSV